MTGMSASLSHAGKAVAFVVANGVRGAAATLLAAALTGCASAPDSGMAPKAVVVGARMHKLAILIDGVLRLGKPFG